MSFLHEFEKRNKINKTASHHHDNEQTFLETNEYKNEHAHRGVDT